MSIKARVNDALKSTVEAEVVRSACSDPRLGFSKSSHSRSTNEVRAERPGYAGVDEQAVRRVASRLAAL